LIHWLQEVVAGVESGAAGRRALWDLDAEPGMTGDVERVGFIDAAAAKASGEIEHGLVALSLGERHRRLGRSAVARQAGDGGS
jgi:hypothetical protein